MPPKSDGTLMNRGNTMGLFAFPASNPPEPRRAPGAALDSRSVNGSQPSVIASPHYRPVGRGVAIAPTVVIPVKNEARNLPIVLSSLPAWVDEVVLVDGRSVDETVAVARQCQPMMTCLLSSTRCSAHGASSRSG